MLRTATVLVLACALIAPAAAAQPAPAANGGEEAGPPADAAGEEGIQTALEHVPDFVAGLLQEIGSWFG